MARTADVAPKIRATRPGSLGPLGWVAEAVAIGGIVASIAVLVAIFA